MRFRFVIRIYEEAFFRAAAILVPIQKPFTSGRRITKSQVSGLAFRLGRERRVLWDGFEAGSVSQSLEMLPSYGFLPFQWNRIVQHSILCSAAQVLWFYGITLCGPLRAILLFEQSTSVVLGALSAAVFGSGGPAKVRGAMLLALGIISLMVLDRDVTVHEHGKSEETGILLVVLTHFSCF